MSKNLESNIYYDYMIIISKWLGIGIRSSNAFHHHHGTTRVCVGSSDTIAIFTAPLTVIGPLH